MSIRTRVLCTLAILSIVAATSSAGAGKSAVPLDKDPDLEAWYTFDETEGKTAADASKNKRAGTLSGQFSVEEQTADGQKKTVEREFSFENNSAEGKIGKALRFMAKNTAVEIKDYKGVTGTASRSVAAWIKTTNTRGNIVVWGANDSGKQFKFGHIRGRIGMTPFGGYYYMKEYTRDDKWHHIAVVVGESDLPNLYDDVTLYLDGEVAELDDIGLLGLLPIETADELDVRIGEGYEGLIDDLRIYKRPLTETEVRTLYQMKSDKPTPTE